MKNRDKAANDITITIYRLMFKPNIDNQRERPALEIAIQLAVEHKGPMFVIESNITFLMERLSQATLIQGYIIARGNVHVLVVDHKEFYEISPSIGHLVDTRGSWM